LARVAPLLCAGITTWSPLVHYGVKKGDSVAVLGLGGLGHMGVKFAHAMGCNVTVLSRTRAKQQDALDLGADKVLITTNESEFKAASRSFDFILDTVSAKHDLNAYTGLLKTDGTLIIVGGVPLVGGIKETQEMLDFCGKHNITSDIELVSCDYANKAWDRMLKSDVKFRFVLDIEKTLVDGLNVLPV
jgi:alcohol dehydrogenase (NADP+)